MLAGLLVRQLRRKRDPLNPCERPDEFSMIGITLKEGVLEYVLDEVVNQRRPENAQCIAQDPTIPCLIADRIVEGEAADREARVDLLEAMLEEHLGRVPVKTIRLISDSGGYVGRRIEDHTFEDIHRE